MRNLFARFSRQQEPARDTVPVSTFWQQQVTPPSVMKALQLDELSSFRQKLLSSGVHGGSIVQYFATQLAAIVAAFAIALGIPLILPIFDVRLTGALGFIIAAYPTERVFTLHKRAKRQMEKDLKKTVDLFSLYASAGQGIHHALRETVASIEGQLADELTVALDSVSGTKGLDVVLRERLPYLPSEIARIFFADLAEALERGIPLKEMMQALRTTLKHEYEQMHRAAGKRMPTKLISIAFVHFFASVMVFIIGVAAFVFVSGVGSA